MATEIKHTPGPWQWDCNKHEGYADVYVNAGEKIIASFNAFIPEGIANARLIASAPEMADRIEALEAALREAREVILALVDSTEEVEFIDAALKQD